MTIELLSAEGQIPVIAGDVEHMFPVTGIRWPEAGSAGALLMAFPDSSKCEYPLPSRGRPFAGTAYVALATLNGNEIVDSRLLCRDGSPDQPIDEGQLQILLRLITGSDPIVQDIIP